MKYFIINFIIIYVIYGERIYFPIDVLKFKNGDSPFIFGLKNKQITNTLSITFILKSDTDIIDDYGNNLFSFGHNSLFFNSINTYFCKKSNTFLRFLLLINNLNNDCNSKNWFNINYLPINWEITVKNIPSTDDYYIITKLISGYNLIAEAKSKKIKKFIKLEDFIINLGSGKPQENVKFNHSIYNLLIFNRKLTDDENRKLDDWFIKPLLFLDFSNSPVYSQYFHNKIENQFLGAINGSSIYYDENDLYYEYIKVSNTKIKKKLYLFNNSQYIKLPQEIIKYLFQYINYRYYVYLKISININATKNYYNLNKDYVLYNRENKFKFFLRLLEIETNDKTRLLYKMNNSNEESELNINTSDRYKDLNYLVVYFEKINHSNKYHIISDVYGIYRIDNLQDILYNDFSENDNHYIGDYNEPKFSISYILIELEEFMIGLGTANKFRSFINNIVVECNVFKKIDRSENLNNCNERKEEINISNSCEYFDISGNCIFKTPDFEDKINSTNLDTILTTILNTYSTISVTTINLKNEINTYINNSGSDLTLNNFAEIYKPYRQNFKNLPIIYINTLKENNISEDFVEFEYNTPFSLKIGSNIIIEINIETKNIESYIFELEFNGISYSNFPIIREKKYQIISLEIYNNSMSNISNPSIKIKKWSSDNFQFKIISIKILEIENTLIEANNKKFIGEKINNFYKLTKDKIYFEDSPKITKYREINNILIECDLSCKECNGPTNKDCLGDCNNDFLKYNDHCMKITAKNCLNVSKNPSFCTDCKIGFSTIKINSDRVFCFNCHSDCKSSSPDCKTTCSNECVNCDPLNDTNGNCKSCPHNCFNFNKNCDTCYGELSIDCYKCKDNTKKIDNNPNNYKLCINCTKKGILFERIDYCDECHPNCKLCSDSKENSCLECKTNFILYYNNICEPIYPNSTCEPNHVLKNGDINNYYERNDKCIKCGQGCNSCELNKINECNDCLYGFHLFNKSCIRCDDDRQFIDISDKDNNLQSKCKQCHPNCKQCNSDSENNCLSCYNNKYLLNIGNNWNKCVLCNDIGYYKKDNFCLKCLNNCLNCLNNKICYNCKSGYYLDNIKKDCVLECRTGTYKNVSTCLKCHENCYSCINNNEFSCIECSNGLYLNVENNQCILCNKVSKIKINKKCYNCHEHCKSCSGLDSNNCLSCKNELILYEKFNKCVYICPENTYKIKINNSYFCRDCHYSCLNCINSKENSCLKCNNNLIYNKYTKRCKLNCENGYYLNKNLCEKCNINCLNCLNFNKCIKCKNNFYLKNNNFCSFCNEEGYYKYNDKCLKCNKNCKSCINYDNCIKCGLNKIKIYNFNNKKYFCKQKCDHNKIFNKELNKCIDCKKCKNCQYKNNYLCGKCLRCTKNCKFNLKFNETGLYLFNKKNDFYFNNTWIKMDNYMIIEDTNIFDDSYFFNINNNNDNLKEINIKITNLSILKSNNCIYKDDKIFNIKKIFNKKCKINKINYDYDSNSLNVGFNFNLLDIEIINNFYYKVDNTNTRFEKYLINNLTLNNEKEIKFKFLPNYYKHKFNVTIYFNNKILKEITCIANKYIEYKYLIDSKKRIYYVDDIEIKLKKLENSVNENEKVKEIFKENKNLIKTGYNSIVILLLISSIFSKLLSLIIRYFQIIYILDFIILLKINFGKYTNLFLKYYVNINYEFIYELNHFLNISYKSMEKKISSVLINNPKLKQKEFKYLTNINLEIIILFFIFLLEIILNLINFIYEKKYSYKEKKIEKIKIENTNDNLKNSTVNNINLKFENRKKKHIKKNLVIDFDKKNNKNYESKFIKNIKILVQKLKALKIAYIGIIFPNLLCSILIYSQIFYNFDINFRNDFKLICIFIIYYILIIVYIYEILFTVVDEYVYNKQDLLHKYREEFFLFKNNYRGIHNYIILIVLVRDFLIVLILLLLDINVIFKLVLFLIIQLIITIISLFMNSDYDYKNISLFKLQEIINLIIIINTFILYYTKFELFQFIIIVFYFILVFISIFNLFYELIKIYYKYFYKFNQIFITKLKKTKFYKLLIIILNFILKRYKFFKNFVKLILNKIVKKNLLIFNYMKNFIYNIIIKGVLLKVVNFLKSIYKNLLKILFFIKKLLIIFLNSFKKVIYFIKFKLKRKKK